MTKINEISGNSLSEALTLLNEVSSLVNKDYRHVTEHLSKGFLSSLKKEKERFEIERNRREDEF